MANMKSIVLALGVSFILISVQADIAMSVGVQICSQVALYVLDRDA